MIEFGTHVSSEPSFAEIKHSDRLKLSCNNQTGCLISDWHNYTTLKFIYDIGSRL